RGLALPLRDVPPGAGGRCAHRMRPPSGRGAQKPRRVHDGLLGRLQPTRLRRAENQQGRPERGRRSDPRGGEGMTATAARTGEILFGKCVKDGIPTRDPLRESDARRLFGPEDGRISLSDVSIKRDVRDFVLTRYPDGGPNKDRFVFVRKEFSEDGS